MSFSQILRFTRIPSILLALLLQCAPVCRFMAAAPAASAPLAYVLKLIGFAATALGAFHAVSGASVVLITSATNGLGTNGTPFRYRITENSPSADPGVWYNATPLPAGLSVNTNTAIISGTPAETGIRVIRLSAGYERELAVPTNLVLTLYGKPVINTQPGSQTVTAGTNASMSVGVTALPSPTYFWRFNGTLISATSNSILVISNVTGASAGPYTVVASNFLGSATSAVAALTVQSGLIPVTITAQPQGKTALLGGAVSLSVMATGSPPITFQWRKEGTNIASATASNLVLSPLALGDSGDYSVVVSNNAGAVTSVVARVNVVQIPRVGDITLQGNELRLTFSRQPGATYEVIYSELLPVTNWLVLTNFPPVVVATNEVLTNLNAGGAMRVFEVRMAIP